MTPLPDAFCLNGSEEGFALLAANRRARRTLNRGFEKSAPRWAEISDTPGGVVRSPEYRAIEVGLGACLGAMMWALHEAGLTSMYWCDGCNGLHDTDDVAAEVFKHAAISGAVGVMPAHKTPQ